MLDLLDFVLANGKDLIANVMLADVQVTITPLFDMALCGVLFSMLYGDTIIDMTLGDKLVRDDLVVRVGKELFLLAKESFRGASTEFVATLADLAKLATDSLFKYVQAIFEELAIKHSQIGNTAHGAKDGLIFEGVVLGAKRSD